MTDNTGTSGGASGSGTKPKKDAQTHLAFNGTLPRAQCGIAKAFMANSNQGIGATEDIAVYINNNCTDAGTEKHDFHAFNDETTLNAVPFLVAVENTRVLRVVYACGTTRGLHGL